MKKLCPHCDGRLKETQDFQKHRMDWVCLRCGRGWKIQENGNWHSRNSAGFECYSSTGEYKGEWYKK